MDAYDCFWAIAGIWLAVFVLVLVFFAGAQKVSGGSDG